MALLFRARNVDWIGCVDFGTAYSKFAMVRAVDREELTKDDIRPLAIGCGQPGVREWFLPSVLYITDKAVLFGTDAEREALRAMGSARDAFRSPKEYLSTCDIDDYDAPLSREVDPTGTFTPRSLLRLFIAYLLHRAHEQAHAEGLPWPVPLRVARPAWEPGRAQTGERLLRDLVVNGFAILDSVGAEIAGSGGLDLQKALSVLKRADETVREAEKKKTISPNMFVVGRFNRISVPEATAVAANSNRARGRRLVVVADIGGGTSDFGAFMTPIRGQKSMAEVGGSSQIVTKAGDYLDMQLIRFILSKTDYLEGHHSARGITRRLTIQGRQNKETLFSEGSLKIEIDEQVLKISLDEFLARPEVQDFAKRLRERFRFSLIRAQRCAQIYRAPNGLEPKIEIMLTGGGNSLPMVQALLTDHGLPGIYEPRAPEIIEGEGIFKFDTVRPQLAVAIGGAMKDLPSTTNLNIDND